MKQVAFIILPMIRIWVQNSVLENLHGYWQPPDCVLSFWVNACKIEYNGPEDYEVKKQIIHQSYLDCVSQFYKDFAI